MMNSVDPGKLDKLIKIFRIDSSNQDSYGFETKGEKSLVRECWAQFTAQSGTEVLKSGSEFSDTKQRFLIRASRTEITEDMIVCYKGKEYPITYVNPYGDSGQYIELWTNRKEKAS